MKKAIAAALSLLTFLVLAGWPVVSAAQQQQPGYPPAPPPGYPPAPPPGYPPAQPPPPGYPPPAYPQPQPAQAPPAYPPPHPYGPPQPYPAAPLPGPAPEAAVASSRPGFPKAGMVVARGTAAFAFSSASFKDTSGQSVGDASTLTLQLGPELGYMVNDAVEIGGAVGVGTSSTEFTPTGGGTPVNESTQTYGIAAFLHYHIVRTETMAFFVGGSVGYAGTKTTTDSGGSSSNSAGNGPRFRAVGGLEFIFGGRGILGVGAALIYDKDEFEADGMKVGEQSGSQFAVFTSLGVVLN